MNKKLIKRIKDLPEDADLSKIRFKSPDGNIWYWYSQWEKGIWCKKNLSDTQIFPLFIDSLQNALEFEVVDDRT